MIDRRDAAGTLLRPARAGKTVLLIEDDADQHLLLAHKLFQSGYKVDSAFDGDQGLKKGISQDHDLVLLDLGLPKLDGRRVLQRLKSSRKTAEIPVIVVTGETNADTIDQTKRLGIVEILRKPVPPREIVEAVNATFRQIDAGLLRPAPPISSRHRILQPWVILLALVFCFFFAATIGNKPAPTRNGGLPDFQRGHFPAPRAGIYLASELAPTRAEIGIWRKKEAVMALPQTPPNLSK